MPLNPRKVLDFKKEDAKPKNAGVSKFEFLPKKGIAKGEAKKLIVQAFDFSLKKEDEIITKSKADYEIKDAMPEKFFPPCVSLISNGLPDGRKRALFALINFLTSLGWGYDDTEKHLKEWNKKNPEYAYSYGRAYIVQSHAQFSGDQGDERGYKAFCCCQDEDLGKCKKPYFCQRYFLADYRYL